MAEADDPAEFIGKVIRVTSKQNSTEFQGIISEIGFVPEVYIVLTDAFIINTNQWIGDCFFRSTEIGSLFIVRPADPARPDPQTENSQSAPGNANPAFQDPAIVSLGRRPDLGSRKNTAKTTPLPKARDPAVILNPADHMTYSSPDETDTATITDTTTTLAGHGNWPASLEKAHPGHIDTVDAQTPASLKTGDLTNDTLGFEAAQKTPTVITSAQAAKKSKRDNRRSNRKKGNAPNTNDEAASTSNQGSGWRETPILESTHSFQPFNSLKKNKNNKGWMSEEVSEVQEAGDFNFQSNLAKFDKTSIFKEMRERDEVDDSMRLVSHNRLPRPKPGTAGGKNLHPLDNVLDLPPTTTGPKLKETPDDFWKSEADEVVLNEGEPLSGRDGSGRNSRLRGESRMSGHRSQSRKASGTFAVAGSARVNTGFTSPLPSGLYALPSNRRVETVTHFQMLAVENVAQNHFELTEDLMAENAGRGIMEVAMKALRDPAILLQNAANSPPNTPTIVVLVGNHKSGMRAIAAARHLRNRNVNVLVCVLGIERENDLQDDIRGQIRRFKKFGGTVCSKSDLFDRLNKPATTLSSSTRVSVMLIIDALLGLTMSFEELRKSDQATAYELMQWANHNDAFVMAIDIPSGIEPSSGKINIIDGFKLCVHPRYVVALGAPKQGLLKALEIGDEQGDALMVAEWKLYLADLGLSPLIWRKAATNKLRRGIDFDEGFVLEMRYEPPYESE